MLIAKLLEINSCNYSKSLLKRQEGLDSSSQTGLYITSKGRNKKSLCIARLPEAENTRFSATEFSRTESRTVMSPVSVNGRLNNSRNQANTNAVPVLIGNRPAEPCEYKLTDIHPKA